MDEIVDYLSSVCCVTTHPYMVRRQLEPQLETDTSLDQWEQTLFQSGELWLDIGGLYVCIDMPTGKAWGRDYGEVQSIYVNTDLKNWTNTACLFTLSSHGLM